MSSTDNSTSQAVETNTTVIEEAERLGVRSYIFVPCIVYGKGTGFGNLISIQTVAIIKAALAVRRVYSVDEGRPTWPVCHIHDNTTLFLALLSSILSNFSPPHGKHGYYLASSGSVAWLDLYTTMAKSLTKRRLINNETVSAIQDDEALRKMGVALGCPPAYVGLQIGGRCTLTARNGLSLGWTPKYFPEHILETADEEVELVLNELKAKDGKL